MRNDWVILHGGALGDLVLTIHLALRLPGVEAGGALRIISRTNPGDLSGCRPRILRYSSEALGLHWLFADIDSAAPERLRELVCGARVLNTLTGLGTMVHRRLAALKPKLLYSFDPRPQGDVQRHITAQWIGQLEQQGLLIPKCVHQRPRQRGIAVSEELRRRGMQLLLGDACHTRPVTPCDVNGRQTAREPVYADSVCAPLILHPGSGGRRKCWPLHCFVELARRLLHARWPVAFLLGPVELEVWNADELSEVGRVGPVIRNPSADELTALLSAAGAFIGNDAGPTHLAALIGTPTIAIFGPTPAAVWRPLGPDVQVLEGNPAGDAADWGLSPSVVAEEVLRWLSDQSGLAENETLPYPSGAPRV